MWKRILLILLVVAAFAWNYQVFSFKYGFVSFSGSEEESTWTQAKYYSSVDEVSYYHIAGDTNVVVFKSKENGSKMFKATNDDLDSIEIAVTLYNDTIGLFTSKIDYKKAPAFPWYVWLIILVVAMIIPLGKKRKR